MNQLPSRHGIELDLRAEQAGGVSQKFGIRHLFLHIDYELLVGWWRIYYKTHVPSVTADNLIRINIGILKRIR